MRTWIFTLLLAGGCSLSGQEFYTSLSEIDMNLSGNYLFQARKNAEIIGSPFLVDEFVPGRIFVDNTWYDEVDLQFDVYNGYFVIKLDDGDYIIDPDKSNIDTIAFNDEIFVKKDRLGGKNMDLTYLSLLADRNGYSLSKEYRTLLKAAIKEGGYQEAQPAEYKTMPPIYYVFKNSDTWEIRGTRTIAEIFDVAPKIVKSYMKEKEYKVSEESDLIEVINYFAQSR